MACARWSLLAVGLLLGAPAGAGAPERARASELWIQGLDAFNAQRHEEACPLLAQASELDPENGSLWADLGMCEAARGHREEAVHASLLAVRHGDGRARMRAYRSLDSLAVRASLPAEVSDLRYTCAELAPPAELECGARLWACVYGYSPRPGQPDPSGIAAVFGSAASKRAELEGVEPAKMGYRKGAPNQIDLEHEDGCAARCEPAPWSCESSKLVKARAASCYRMRAVARRLPSEERCRREGGSDCDLLAQCFQETCDLALAAYENPSTWPQVIQESRQSDAPCESCQGAGEQTCQILAVDPCHKRVGYTCTRGEGHVPELRELVIDEGPVQRPGRGGARPKSGGKSSRAGTGTRSDHPPRR